MKYDVTKGGCILLGRCGENLARTVAIDVSKYLVEYPGAVVTLLHRRHGESGIYPVAAELRDGCLVWQPTSADTAIAGSGEAEVRVTVNGVLAKSKILSTMVDKSLTGQETDAPEPGMDWVDKITTAIGNVQNMKAEAESVAYGEPASAEYDGKTGTMHFGIPEGRPGRDGTDGAPGAKGEKGDPGEQGLKGDPGSDANVTAENIQSALGYAPVKDVQVAGASVMADGVANVPMASENGNLGVVRDNPSIVQINAEGKIFPMPAMTWDIDGRTANNGYDGLPNNRVVIPPSRLDYAVKAAMCDGKGAAWTVAEQKAARERMGVDKPYELIEEITIEEENVSAITRDVDRLCSAKLTIISPPMESIITANALIFFGDANKPQYIYLFSEIAPSKVGRYRHITLETELRNNYWRVYKTTESETGDMYPNGSWTTSIGETAPSRLMQLPSSNLDVITKITLNAYPTGAYIPVGTKITIYGVRA